MCGERTKGLSEKKIKICLVSSIVSLIVLLPKSDETLKKFALNIYIRAKRNERCPGRDWIPKAHC